MSASVRGVLQMPLSLSLATSLFSLLSVCFLFADSSGSVHAWARQPYH